MAVVNDISPVMLMTFRFQKLIHSKLYTYLKLALLQEEKTFGRHNKTSIFKFHFHEINLA